ncbi:MAG: DUF3795 domain-containing protein [Candidatus Bathyarchaeota archaeon]|nr:MAG: DUF3795 domain-containing protein [Candidatus Bathyarchaeota archaeon]
MCDKDEKPLLGICGAYCGACTTYRAYNDNDQELIEWEIKTDMPRDEIYCRGCLSDLVNKWCANCNFRKCAGKRGIIYCFECEEFPCKKLVDFSKTRPHRVLGLNNLKRLREISIDEWLKEQEKRWACPACSKKLHWYSEECPDCGPETIDATQEAASVSQP